MKRREPPPPAVRFALDARGRLWTRGVMRGWCLLGAGGAGANWRAVWSAHGPLTPLTPVPDADVSSMRPPPRGVTFGSDRHGRLWHTADGDTWSCLAPGAVSRPCGWWPLWHSYGPVTPLAAG